MATVDLAREIEGKDRRATPEPSPGGHRLSTLWAEWLLIQVVRWERTTSRLTACANAPA